MDAPKVICHMTVSLDGKVTGAFLEREAGVLACEHYYKIHREMGADAFACGRVTMNGSFTKDRKPDLRPFAGVSVPAGDYVAQTAQHYAVAFDRRGTLGWKQSHIVDEDPGYDNAHIIEVLSEGTDKSYLAYLRSIGVSYIIGGVQDLDLKTVLHKLKTLFGINLLLLEGGGTLNGAFQREGLIDELSLVLTPLTAGGGEKSVFEDGVCKDYRLIDAQVLEDGNLWLRYQA